MNDRILKLLPFLALAILSITVGGSLLLFINFHDMTHANENLYRDNVFEQGSQLMRVSFALARYFGSAPGEGGDSRAVIIGHAMIAKPLDTERIFKLIGEDPLLLELRIEAAQKTYDEQLTGLIELNRRLQAESGRPAVYALEKSFAEAARRFVAAVEERSWALAQFDSIFFNQIRSNRKIEDDYVNLLLYVQVVAVALTVIIVLLYYRLQRGQVNLLHGMIPICSNCKKVRDDAGYWEQVEEYVRQRSGVEFSHGLCPECIKKLYPQFAEKAGPATGKPSARP